MYWPRGTILSRIVIFQVNISYIANVPGVKFTLVLKRRPLYYLFNIIIPTVLLATLSAVTFVVPVDSGEKISFGIAILLAFSMFMLILQDNTPQTDMPILCTYIPFWDNNVDIWLMWWAASLNPIGIYAYECCIKITLHMSWRTCVVVKQIQSNPKTYCVKNDTFQANALAIWLIIVCWWKVGK